MSIDDIVHAIPQKILFSICFPFMPKKFKKGKNIIESWLFCEFTISINEMKSTSKHFDRITILRNEARATVLKSPQICQKQYVSQNGHLGHITILPNGSTFCRSDD